MIGGGPPCQGVSGLNFGRKGAVEGPRSSLHSHVKRIIDLVRSVFSWAKVFFLMESVFSMSWEDRAVYSTSIKVLPYLVDAKHCSLARRPRLWWFNWAIRSEDGVRITLPGSPDCHEYGEVRFEASVEASRYLEPGWALAGPPDCKFNTFTTSQPSAKPRWRPAGIDSCTPQELELWAADSHRFPPYQYKRENGVHHLKKGWRLPSL